MVVYVWKLLVNNWFMFWEKSFFSEISIAVKDTILVYLLSLPLTHYRYYGVPYICAWFVNMKQQ